MRPSFLLSKAERRGSDLGLLLPRYRDAYVARLVWEGLPEGCPKDYIESMLFWHGAVGAKKVRGLGPVVLGAAPSMYDLYGHPARWTPAGVHPTDLSGDPLGGALFAESDGPILALDNVPSQVIEPYLEIQRKAVNALNQNMAALAMPIILETQPGAELNAKLIKQNLGSGDIFLQTIDRGTLGAEILDLKAQDHSQSLISVIHDCDSTILDILHIRAALEKSAGISPEESLASNQQLEQGLKMEVELRREWADEVNDKLRMDLSVTINKTEESADSGEYDDDGRRRLQEAGGEPAPGNDAE